MEPGKTGIQSILRRAAIRLVATILLDFADSERITAEIKVENRPVGWMRSPFDINTGQSQRTPANLADTYSELKPPVHAGGFSIFRVQDIQICLSPKSNSDGDLLS